MFILLNVLTLIELIFISVLVKGWTFPRRSVELTLPEDYPLNTPFYRISILLSERDILKNVTADLNMKVVPFRKIQMRASSINKKEQYVRLDKSTGILTFVKVLPNSGTIGKFLLLYAQKINTCIFFTQNIKTIKRYNQIISLKILNCLNHEYISNLL